MIYEFKCYDCGSFESVNSRPLHPPKLPVCDCGNRMDRVFGCNIDTSMCRDHDHIPAASRVARGPMGVRNAAREERRFHDHIQRERALLKDGNRGSIRKTHSVPADLYHGKIRETGDADYWRDSSNMRKHKTCKVDS